MSDQKPNNTPEKPINDVVKESNTVKNQDNTNIQIKLKKEQEWKNIEDQIKLKKEQDRQKKEFENHLKLNLLKFQRVRGVWEREEGMSNTTFFKLMGCLFAGAAALALLFWYWTSYKHGSMGSENLDHVIKTSTLKLKKCPSIYEEYLNQGCSHNKTPECDKIHKALHNCDDLARRLKDLVNARKK